MGASVIYVQCNELKRLLKISLLSMVILEISDVVYCFVDEIVCVYSMNILSPV